MKCAATGKWHIYCWHSNSRSNRSTVTDKRYLMDILIDGGLVVSRRHGGEACHCVRKMPACFRQNCRSWWNSAKSAPGSGGKLQDQCQIRSPTRRLCYVKSAAWSLACSSHGRPASLEADFTNKWTQKGHEISRSFERNIYFYLVDDFVQHDIQVMQIAHDKHLCCQGVD